MFGVSRRLCDHYWSLTLYLHFTNKCRKRLRNILSKAKSQTPEYFWMDIDIMDISFQQCVCLFLMLYLTGEKLKTLLDDALAKLTDRERTTQTSDKMTIGIVKQIQYIHIIPNMNTHSYLINYTLIEKSMNK